MTARALLSKLVKECSPKGIPSDTKVHGVTFPSKETLEECRKWLKEQKVK